HPNRSGCPRIEFTNLRFAIRNLQCLRFSRFRSHMRGSCSVLLFAVLWASGCGRTSPASTAKLGELVSSDAAIDLQDSSPTRSQVASANEGEGWFVNVAEEAG